MCPFPRLSILTALPTLSLQESYPAVPPIWSVESDDPNLAAVLERLVDIKKGNTLVRGPWDRSTHIPMRPCHMHPVKGKGFWKEGGTESWTSGAGCLGECLLKPEADSCSGPRMGSPGDSFPELHSPFGLEN